MTNATTRVLLERIGTNIRRARQNARMSQIELAGSSGVDRSYISRIEHAKENPSIDVLAGLAAALDVTLPDLINAKSNRRPIGSRGIQKSRRQQILFSVTEAAPTLYFMWNCRFIDRENLRKCSDRISGSFYAPNRINSYVNDIGGAIGFSFLQAINNAARDKSPELNRMCLEVADACDGLLAALGYPDVPVPVEGAPPDARLGIPAVPDRPLMREIECRSTKLDPELMSVKRHLILDVYYDAYDVSDIKYRIDYFRRCCRYIAESPRIVGKRMIFGKVISDQLLMDILTEYLRMHRIKPIFTDRHRHPDGETTLWVRDIIRMSAKNLEAYCELFSSNLPAGPWLKTVRQRLLGLDQLTAQTLSKRLQVAWNRVQEEYRSRYGVDIDVSKPWGRLPRRKLHH